MWTVVKLGVTNLLQSSLKEASCSSVSGESVYFNLLTLPFKIAMFMSVYLSLYIKHDVMKLMGGF